MKKISFVSKNAEGGMKTSGTIHLASMSHKDQIGLVNQLFIGEDVSNCILLSRDIEKKRYSYYQQDLRKQRIEDITEILTKDEIIEKLVVSRLRCKYCKKIVVLFYDRVRDPQQWSLDRLDNSLSHTADNTCIACLKCNLERRTTSVDSFSFTKSLRIRKLD